MSTPADSQDPGSGIGWFNESTGEWDKAAPSLPYAGTSGWSGSETSEARARDADADGTTSKRQEEVVRRVREQREHGMTVKELRLVTGWHHGQASSALTILHKSGALERLSEVRDRCKVYVRPMYVAGRETEAPGRTRGSETAVQAERARILNLIAEQGAWISARLVEQIVNDEV